MSYKIGIDDGHGYETAGKRTPDGYRENYFNEKVKKFLIPELKRNGFSYVDCSPMTSDNSLQDRCNRANNANVNIFVSIHANAYGEGNWNSADGVETYYYPGSSSGKKLATLVQNELLKGTKQDNRGVKSADFYVLRKTTMTAILVEAAFMTNKKEADLLKKESFQKETAKDICRGICKYFSKSYVKESTTTTKPKTGYTGILKEAFDKGWFIGEKYKETDNINFENLCYILRNFENYMKKKYNLK
jgi:N-acetylmuramoyl-L-alanine amidase